MLYVVPVLIDESFGSDVLIDESFGSDVLSNLGLQAELQLRPQRPQAQRPATSTLSLDHLSRIAELDPLQRLNG